MIASTQSFYERIQPHHSWLRFDGDGDSELMKRSKIAETVRQRMAHSVFLYHQSACNWRLAQRAASATCLKLGMFRVLPCQEPASQHHWRQKSESAWLLTAGKPQGLWPAIMGRETSYQFAALLYRYRIESNLLATTLCCIFD